MEQDWKIRQTNAIHSEYFGVIDSISVFEENIETIYERCQSMRSPTTTGKTGKSD
jgi:hypothetical protein